MATIQKIVPCLWFDDRADEAASFYVSVFEGSRIRRVTHYGHEGSELHGREPGSVMSVDFEIAGCAMTALNGGRLFEFNEAISLQVRCTTQEEIDRYWDRLSEGGDEKAQRCGWLKDQFGVSWQIVPALLAELIDDDDAEKAERTMRALLRMKKLDIAGLKRAHDGA